MADSWTMSAGGRIYGPYTSAQMRVFVGEGRLAAHSMVARAGTDDFLPAGGYSELEDLFPKPERLAYAQPIRSEAPSPKFGRVDGENAGSERARFVIFSDMKSRSVSGLEEEIFNLGPAYEIMPQAWIVATTLSLTAIRNVLVQKLGKIDVLYIVDITRNKGTWYNFGPEAEARIRRVWNAAPDLSTGRKAAE
ncbi:MAG TPA: DUF4339 domain-containing protein [Rhizomicrobium sp.]|jgi:hypothetical protein|nr:DUF4339 domain-containing protein [Rhizomicrobium sp.]